MHTDVWKMKWNWGKFLLWIRAEEEGENWLIIGGIVRLVSIKGDTKGIIIFMTNDRMCALEVNFDVE